MASAKVSFQDLKTLIKDKKLKNLVLLSGEEDYYCEFAVNEIKKTYLSKDAYQMDFVKLSFESKAFDLEKVIENTELPPWMSEMRIVLVRNSGIFDVADPKKELAEAFEKFAKNIPETSMVIFWDDKIDGRKKGLLSIFEKNGTYCDCPILKDHEIAEKIANNLRMRNLTIDSDACDSLINRTTKSMRAIANEITKITYYCASKGITNVDYSVIEALCPPDVNSKIFDMLDAISEGNSGKALTILNNLIILGEKEIKIKYTFANQLRKLICAKELNSEKRIKEELGVSDFAAKKLKKQSQKFPMEKLIALFSSCAKTEYEGRIGKLDERQSLEILLVLACNSLT